MDEFSLLQYFSDQPASDGGMEARSPATPCGLEAATPIDGQSADVGGAGLVVEVEGQLYDLGDDEGSITLADDSGFASCESSRARPVPPAAQQVGGG